MWVALAIAAWALGWGANVVLARSQWHDRRVVRIAVPVIFGMTLIVMWEALVRGFEVSPVILPAPSVVAATFATSTDILWTV